MEEINEEISPLLGSIDYFITGSRRFGTCKQESDIDVCILINKRQELFDKAVEPKLSNYNNGFKTNVNGREVNIIPLHPLDFVAWFYAAKLMCETPNLSEKTRPQLHGLHETYIGLMKSHFSGELVSFDNCLKICGMA